MFCGKIASGKSTLATQVASQGAVLIVEDDWLRALFADQMKTGADYLRCSGRLRSVMGAHVTSLLNAGMSVSLDFAANTIDQRRWMRGILDDTTAAHQLHVLDTPDDDCLTRLSARNAAGEHPFTVSEEQFQRFSNSFVRPAAEEGFNLVVHCPNAS
nr:ATP-binding protein [Tropicimonas marinistellae]